MSLPLRILLPGLLFGGLAFLALRMDAEGGPSRQLAFALLTGAALGIVLQRARFCFLCNLRDLVEARDPRGVLSILAALAAGLVGYFVIFGMWLPVPAADRLPPTAHIGPVSAALAIGALAFGVGMAIAGSCISAHIYRLGEGNLASVFALGGAFIGFILGFLSWNNLFLADLATGPVIWLPHHLGYAGALAVSLTALAALALLALWYGRATPAQPVHQAGAGAALKSLLVTRWPPIVGGVLVGVIGTFAYLRFAPLGVTSQLGSWARKAASNAQVLPDTLYSLDTFRGCATAIGEALLSPNGYLISGLVLGSLAAALASGQFALAVPSLGQIARNVVGGILMGWGAMIALGCTIGVLLSGIQAGALAGWVFLVVCTTGAVITLFVRRRLSA